MRLVTLGLLILLTADGMLAQSPAPIRVRPIRGRVVDATDDVPLRRARIVLSVGDRRIDSVFTDDEGRFSIGIEPSGTLTARASKAGYAASLVTIPADDVVPVLRFALTKSAAVMGRVLDSAGSPAPAFVTYIRGQLIGPTAGTVPGSSQFFTQTDALGEYRLGGLPAGRYEITAVQVRPETRRQGGPLGDLVFGPPDSLDVARGTATMSLATGDEVRDVNFTIAGARRSCPTGPSVRPPPDAVRASILGRVTGANGEPLACAVVRLVAPDMGVPQVYTDRQGRYSIEGLRDGSFIVEARMFGYGTIQYGQRYASDAEVPITLCEGQRRTGVDIVMPRLSMVTGTIVDEYGEPVEGISVWTFQLRRSEGRTTARSTTGPRTTDDRGQYRLIGVEPGTYLIAAMGRDLVSDAKAERARGYPTVFYPGVPDALAAQRLTLAAGRDAHGIDIALAPTRTATVSGSALDGAGRPFTGTVTLEASARSGSVDGDQRSVSTDTNGGFAIRNVPPGDYVVKAVESSGSAPRFGRQYVTVVDGDPPPVTVVLSAGATLEGRLVIDGLSDPNMAGLGVSVAPADSDYMPPIRRQPTMWARNSDGTFRAAGVVGPSRLTITETPACADCYLKSALVNGMDAADRPFDFGLTGGTYRDVEVVVSDAGATIEGRATSDRNAGVAAFSVVVFSTSRDLWYPRSRYLKTRRSGADGKVRVTGLPPGDYYVVAVTGLESLPFVAELDDPDVLEQLAARAQQVTLTERERRTLTLRLVHRQGSQP